ncbi:hypothetical protein SAMN05216417_10177 [Nitrosospira multiformis]|uniref:Uncharacterized protein n=1 Tax=Nitrosospira multiformis TaxID=1231 RepID=A0A1I7F2X8_9PROT|nr:hypothetical protein SAMN05216417_10177 [Nitrosospira multiformis]
MNGLPLLQLEGMQFREAKYSKGDYAYTGGGYGGVNSGYTIIKCRNSLRRN